jgi:hypothetical protein
VAEHLQVGDDRFGERPEHGTPLPNRADAAFAELEALRAEAGRLGLEDYHADPLAVLRERVERAKEAFGES